MRTLFIAAILLLTGTWAKAAVLITIDLSHPSQAVFTATGAFSSVNISSGAGFDTQNSGVSIQGFFISAPPHSGNVTAGDVEADSTTFRPSSVAATFFDSIYWDNSSGSSFLSDFSLFDAGTSVAESFSTSSAAFAGALTINLGGSVRSHLPTVGATGNIIAGWSGSTKSAVFGTWQVVGVPEPSTTGLLFGAAMIAVAAVTRRRPLFQIAR